MDIRLFATVKWKFGIYSTRLGPCVILTGRDAHTMHGLCREIEKIYRAIASSIRADNHASNQVLAWLVPNSGTTTSVSLSLFSLESENLVTSVGMLSTQDSTCTHDK
jgi:hypothetical protein